MSRAACFRRRAPLPVLPYAVGVELDAGGYIWAERELGCRWLLGPDGLPWHEEAATEHEVMYWACSYRWQVPMSTLRDWWSRDITVLLLNGEFTSGNAGSGILNFKGDCE